MGGLFFIGIVFMLIGMLVQWRLKSKFKQYSEVGLANNMSGAEIADKMLKQNGIYDVKVTQVEGQLTDHYDPTSKTVNLSPDVYNGRSVAAAAVSAHECGHAVQHATHYGALRMRSALVPVVNICSNVMNYANMFLMMGLGYSMSQGSSMGNIVLMVLIAANLGVTAFSLITLPVEFDASNRALKWIENQNIVTKSEYAGAKDALKWAAMTYVVAALGALANLWYYLQIFLGGRRNED